MAFFQRCKTGLAPGGIIVVKENICSRGFVVDKVRPVMVPWSAAHHLSTLQAVPACSGLLLCLPLQHQHMHSG